MKTLKKAIIRDNWIRCPTCGKKQFMLYGGEVIHGLKFRCRTSNSRQKHYFLIDTGNGGEQ